MLKLGLFKIAMTVLHRVLRPVETSVAPAPVADKVPATPAAAHIDTWLKPDAQSPVAAEQISTPSVVAVAEPTVVEMLPVVETVDYDTPENRTFSKTHPRYGAAAAAVRRFLSENDGPATAREIADYVRGPGGVPEFMVPVKSLSNRLLGMGLVRSNKGTMSVWNLDEQSEAA
jgi:hypothetical protein